MQATSENQRDKLAARETVTRSYEDCRRAELTDDKVIWHLASHPDRVGRLVAEASAMRGNLSLALASGRSMPFCSVVPRLSGGAWPRPSKLAALSELDFSKEQLTTFARLNVFRHLRVAFHSNAEVPMQDNEAGVVTRTFGESGVSEAERIGQLAEAGEQMVERLRRTAFLPGAQKGLNVRVGIAEAAELLGCSTNRIRMAEQDGRLPTPPETETGRRIGYDVPALLNMRNVLGASPRRAEHDPPAIITVQNFKGGVGKSTVTTHLAHYLAMAGYRVLVVDCDSQATTTTLFGFNPHFAIRREETLYPYLSIEPTEDDLRYAVKSTIWPNVDLIPSNLQMFDVEYELAAAGAGGSGTLVSRFRKLREGLAALAQDYDVVLLDPPPALGTISLAVMQAANALLVPLAATTPDFCSTVQFLSMMDQVIGQLKSAGISVEYDFCRLICSKFNANDPSHAMVQQVMEQTFGASLLPVPILESAEISHAALRMMSIYELEKPIGTPKTHKRCRTNLDEAMAQVEQLIRRRWGRATTDASKMMAV